MPTIPFLHQLRIHKTSPTSGLNLRPLMLALNRGAKTDGNVTANFEGVEAVRRDL
jgi:hypothetical protein